MDRGEIWISHGLYEYHACRREAGAWSLGSKSRVAVSACNNEICVRVDTRPHYQSNVFPDQESHFAELVFCLSDLLVSCLAPFRSRLIDKREPLDLALKVESGAIIIERYVSHRIEWAASNVLYYYCARSRP